MTDTINEVVKQLDEAFNRGDLEDTLNFYTENAAVVIEPGTVIKGKSKIREAFQQVMKINGKAKQLKTNIIETEETALFTSHWIFEELLSNLVYGIRQPSCRIVPQPALHLQI